MHIFRINFFMADSVGAPISQVIITANNLECQKVAELALLCIYKRQKQTKKKETNMFRAGEKQTRCFGVSKQCTRPGFGLRLGKGISASYFQNDVLSVKEDAATERKEHTFALLCKHVTKHTQVQKHINSCNCVQADCISALTVLTIYSRADALWVFFAMEQIKIQMYTQTSSTTD